MQNAKGMENLTSCAAFFSFRVVPLPSFASRTASTPNADGRKEEKRTWFATKLSHLRLHLFARQSVRACFLASSCTSPADRRLACATATVPKEKKSVISNFLIVIVFVLYCVPLWLFMIYLWSLCFCFSFVQSLGSPQSSSFDFWKNILKSKTLKRYSKIFKDISDISMNLR